MGLGRFELPTPRLSSVCSNQLSYRPLGHADAAFRTEVRPQRRDTDCRADSLKTEQDDAPTPRPRT